MRLEISYKSITCASACFAFFRAYIMTASGQRIGRIIGELKMLVLLTIFCSMLIAVYALVEFSLETSFGEMIGYLIVSLTVLCFGGWLTFYYLTLGV